MKNKPVYLYITPFFPTPEEIWSGGYCLDAVKALMRTNRYDVRVLVMKPGNNYTWEGIPITRLPVKSFPSGVAPFVFEKVNNKLLIQTLSQLNINLVDIAICHVNTMGGAAYAYFLKKQNPKIKTLIHHHCSYGLTMSSGRLGILPIHATLLYMYYRRLCMGVDAHVFVSKMSKETFGYYFLKEPEGEIRDIRQQMLLGRFLPQILLKHSIVLHNGVDSSSFFPNEKTTQNGFTIGCVANYQPLKDHLTLLKAISLVSKKIPRLRLRLIGSGILFEKCKEYTQSIGISSMVSFEKEVDHSELREFYQSLDLFVLPSRLEGFACVYVESHACGTPVIGCRTTSLREILPEEEHHLWLCKPKDAYDLAAKILHYYNKRPQQHLSGPIDIDVLIQRFLCEVEKDIPLSPKKS